MIKSRPVLANLLLIMRCCWCEAEACISNERNDRLQPHQGLRSCRINDSMREGPWNAIFAKIGESMETNWSLPKYRWFTIQTSNNDWDSGEAIDLNTLILRFCLRIFKLLFRSKRERNPSRQPCWHLLPTTNNQSEVYHGWRWRRVWRQRGIKKW